jgi:hypothetical protein
VMLLLAFLGWWLISLGQSWPVIVVIALGIGLGANAMLGPQCPPAAITLGTTFISPETQGRDLLRVEDALDAARESVLDPR